MRRHDREENRAFALDVIDRCEYGVAAFGGEEPYCLPLSLVRVGEEPLFHCALEGKKLDLLRKDPRVCISFVTNTQLCPEEFTTYFESAQVVGTARELTDLAERTAAMRVLCEKLAASNMVAFDGAIQRSLHRTGVWAIRMEQVTGKAKKQNP